MDHRAGAGDRTWGQQHQLFLKGSGFNSQYPQVAHSSRGPDALFRLPWIIGTLMVHRHNAGKTPTHMILKCTNKVQGNRKIKIPVCLCPRKLFLQLKQSDYFKLMYIHIYAYRLTYMHMYVLIYVCSFIFFLSFKLFILLSHSLNLEYCPQKQLANWISCMSHAHQRLTTELEDFCYCCCFELLVGWV